MYTQLYQSETVGNMLLSHMENNYSMDFQYQKKTLLLVYIQKLRSECTLYRVENIFRNNKNTLYFQISEPLF